MCLMCKPNQIPGMAFKEKQLYPARPAPSPTPPLLPVLLRTAACKLSALDLYIHSESLSSVLTLPISVHDLRHYLLTTSYCGRPGLNSEFSL